MSVSTFYAISPVTTQWYSLTFIPVGNCRVLEKVLDRHSWMAYPLSSCSVARLDSTDRVRRQRRRGGCCGAHISRWATRRKVASATLMWWIPYTYTLHKCDALWSPDRQRCLGRHSIRALIASSRRSLQRVVCSRLEEMGTY